MALTLAPLAGYTDKAFREIAVGFGAEETVTEMVSAEGLARKSSKTKALLEPFDRSENLTLQLFGPDADTFYRALKVLRWQDFSKIDINAGCPVPKVVKTGAGSALMKTPEKAGEIIHVLKEETGLRISIKFRLGWDSDSINFLEFADIAAEAGAEMLTLHARTRAQGYSGTADRKAFSMLSEHFKGSGILLFGSGDVFTPEDAMSLINDSGLSGVMFARGAIGNPFIFRETKELIEKGCYSLPSTEEKISVALKHLRLMVSYYGENTGCREMRKHLMAYIKGIRGANKVKVAISEAVTEKEITDAMNTLLISEEN